MFRYLDLWKLPSASDMDFQDQMAILALIWSAQAYIINEIPVSSELTVSRDITRPLTMRRSQVW